MEQEIPSETQLLIDKKILSLQQSIQNLKNQRNQHARIARLPPEILGNVFAEVASTIRLKPFGPMLSPATRFNFSFISQHWRIVALATPELWGILPDGHSDWCQVMLQRSRTTGLTVNSTLCYIDSPRGNFLREVVTKHANRLQDLELRFAATNKTDILEFLPYSTPRLRALHLTINLSYHADQVKLPDDRFSNAQLSTLEVKGCLINWNSSLFSGLRSMKIMNNHANSTSLSDFLGALRRMPKLETLHFENFALLPAVISALDSPPIQLPSLRCLCISSTTFAVTNILRCFAVPASARVDLSCDPSDTGAYQTLESSSALCSALVSFFSLMIHGESIDAPYSSLSISDNLAKLRIATWSDTSAHESFNPTRTDEPNLSLQLHLKEVLLAQMIKAIPLRHIKSLSLSTLLQCDNLVSVFSNLPKLEAVIFDGESGVGPEVIKALTYPKNATNASDNRVSFPNLKHMSLYENIFSGRDVYSITLDELRDCCMERFERGAPITKVFIWSSFDIYKKDIQLLEEIVVDVDWDGEEIEFLGETDSEEDDYGFGEEDRNY